MSRATRGGKLASWPGGKRANRQIWPKPNSWWTVAKIMFELMPLACSCRSFDWNMSMELPAPWCDLTGSRDSGRPGSGVRGLWSGDRSPESWLSRRVN